MYAICSIFFNTLINIFIFYQLSQKKVSTFIRSCLCSVIVVNLFHMRSVTCTETLWVMCSVNKLMLKLKNKEISTAVGRNLDEKCNNVKGMGIFSYKNFPIKWAYAKPHRLECVPCNCLSFLVLLVIISTYLNIVEQWETYLFACVTCETSPGGLVLIYMLHIPLVNTT